MCFIYWQEFFLNFLFLDEDWEEEHEKLAEFLGEIPKNYDNSNNSNIYMLEDEEECAYPGPQPKNLRKAQTDRAGDVELEADNENAANVAASISQIILDDDDIDSIISRPINFSKSMGSKVLFIQLCNV